MAFDKHSCLQCTLSFYQKAGAIGYDYIVSAQPPASQYYGCAVGLELQEHFQYRLITSENTTNKPSNHLFLGGWTFGHINVQSPSAGRVNNMVNGLDTFLAAMENASSTIQIDWRAAVRNTTSWSSTNDSFNPNMTVLEALKKFIGNLDTTDITKVWFNNKLYSSLPINTNPTTTQCSDPCYLRKMPLK
uniref:Uncharacterized protein n=1 Tax=Ditylenchus dipsaci TaxID=166011 RepID=A0A915CQT4_9BILA